MAEQTNGKKSNPPTHVVKVRHGYGKNASYERIGVAWQKENGALYVKLHGTQIVSDFSLYELPGEGASENPD
ncbi:MAG: hypothetical protein H6868_08235 [Rhodospirillales bacterium]|nr:hypothetical protein [Rhodospirillales bacterium]